MTRPVWPRTVTAMVAAAFASGLLIAGLFNLPRHSAAQPTGATVASAPASAPDLSALTNLSDAFASIAERVKPSVVYIESTHREKRTAHPEIPREFAPFFHGRPGGPDQPELSRASGSGFVVSADGDILTNAHVVEDADRVTVRLLDHRQFVARVIGTDPTTDVALLHIDAHGLAPAVLGNSDNTRVGEWVLAVGNPLGENLSFTVTSGIVSAKGRTLQLPNQTERSIQDFIQTDAAINPGNSGGPLVNVKGEVIGINSAIASETGYYTGYGFAIPVNLVRHVMDQLAHGGQVHRAALGVRVKNATETDAAYVGLSDVRGVVVEDIGDSDSPARKAGLEQGDVIVAVDGKSVDYVGQVQQAVAFRNPGDEVDIEVARKGGAHRTLHVRLAEVPATVAAVAEAERAPTDDESGRTSVARLGLTVASGEEGGVRGLIVAAVDPEGPCADQIATPDEGGPDVLVSVEGKPVTTAAELRAALQAAGPGAIIEMVVYNAPTKSRRIERVRLP
jgi:serine protease Do